MLQIRPFTFNPFSENTYVIFNENKEAFILDPGNVQDSETRQLQDFIFKNDLKIKNILLTHAHIDHVLGLQWAYDAFKVPVLMHRDDQEVLERNPMSARQFGFFFKPLEGEIQYVSEGDEVRLGSDIFKVYHVPGHSPGSVAYHCEEQKLVVSGDVLFEGSIGRTDLYKGDFNQLIESIRTKLFVLNDETTVYAGHGHLTRIGFEKQHNPFLK